MQMQLSDEDEVDNARPPLPPSIKDFRSAHEYMACDFWDGLFFVAAPRIDPRVVEVHADNFPIQINKGSSHTSLAR